eukprot:TRINITY_DN1770_c0_g1_i1.p1 TRINITY_DN1770_c0_g1~~TRINITY_DN1770_c0_g1_i1.p1  ORF type:complete len:485 (-),score=147.62 TRINITY_DN1770_c0_g1_i1:8-1462(-)
MAQSSSSSSFQPSPFTPIDEIPAIVQELRSTFRSGVTKSLSWRKQQLNALLSFCSEKREQIKAAVTADLGRHEFEADLADIMSTEGSIRHMLSNLTTWAQPRGVSTPLSHMKGLTTSQVVPEPKGVVLVISPWNYPINLPLGGAATAICAGNCVLIKPSEVSEHCTDLLVRELPKYMDSSAIRIVTGGVEETTALLKERYDHILYTGNGTVGRIIMRAAAEYLTPVTLELGGKSPVYVDKNVDLDVAVKRLVWGKCFNTGQTCIACDYVLVHSSIKDTFLHTLQKTVTKFYGEKVEQSASYGRIINARQWKRLNGYINAAREENSESIIVGGDVDEEKLFISPTVIYPASADSAVMKEEIFGPILPIIEVKGVQEAIDFINDRPKPLALYVFSKRQKVWQKINDNTSSGQFVVNETLMQFVNPHLPFGGIGESGMGAYHGITGFDTLSHLKAVVNKTTWFDLDARYPPYSQSKLNIIGTFSQYN